MKNLTILLTLSSLLILGFSSVATQASEVESAEPPQAEQMRDRHEHRRARHEKRMDSYLNSKVDTNQDGVISYEEFMANAKSRFETSDLNSDGEITEDERKEAAKIMREKHHKAMREARETHKNAMREAREASSKTLDQSDD